MKRVLFILSLVAALFVTSACSYDTNLSVTASAELISTGYRKIPLPRTQIDRVFHSNHFSDMDLEYIFSAVSKGSNIDFMSATLYLEVFDNISGEHLWDEAYSITVNGNGGLDFAEYPI